jgi:hypothetical protein
MKNALLLSLLLSVVPAAAFAADLAVEPTAAPVVSTGGAYSGYVSVNGSATNWDYFGDDYNPWVGLGAEAALAYQLDANWQIEAELTAWTAQESYQNYYSPYGGVGALHVNYGFDGGSVGAFGGIAVSNNYYDYGSDYNALGGVEGQIAVTDNLILDGQVGGLTTVSGYDKDDYGVNAAFAQARAKFFPLDNLELSAYVGLVKGDMTTDGYDFSAVTYGAEVEYQFEDTPFSVFAAYQGFSESEWDMNGSTVKVGAKFSFDGESLKDQAKTGASHNVADLSPISWVRLDW